MLRLKKHSDDLYLNDFHKKWNEACMKENERIKSLRFTAEHLRKQAERMDRLSREQEIKDRELRKQRKNSSKNGL